MTKNLKKLFVAGWVICIASLMFSFSCLLLHPVFKIQILLDAGQYGFIGVLVGLWIVVVTAFWLFLRDDY